MKRLQKNKGNQPQYRLGMKKTASIITFTLVLLTSVLTSFQFVGSASANPEGSTPQLAMPVEYVNYTITRVNGTLWAKIDGDYPIYIQKQPNCSFDGELPMLYPMPPQTTNIHVTLGDRELAWSNYTQDYPEALHHTAIGDWWMIYSLISPISDFFVLKIHYEHPLSAVNGSYLFLYDLNISPYLSPQNKNSTAYFTVRMETNTTNLHVYTAPPDSVASEWKLTNYSTTEGSTKIVSITMYSEYDKLLVGGLPGDLVVEFSDADGVPEFPYWVVPVLVVAVSAALLYLKRKRFFQKLEQNSYLRQNLPAPEVCFIWVVFDLLRVRLPVFCSRALRTQRAEFSSIQFLHPDSIGCVEFKTFSLCQ